MAEARLPVNTYHGHMCEAIKSTLSAMELAGASKAPDQTEPNRLQLLEDAGMQARHSFLLAALALEAAANGLLAGQRLQGALNGAFLKLQTLQKFELVSLLRGKQLERGAAHYQRVQELVKCRNSYVHPKPSWVQVDVGDDGELGLPVTRSAQRRYPDALEYVTPENSADAVRDVLAFVAWVVLDTCGMGDDGIKQLSCGYVCTTGDVSQLGQDHGVDLRTFDTGRG